MSIDSSSIFHRNFKIYISVIIYMETATIWVQPQLSSSNSLGVMIKWRVVVISKLWNRVKSSNSINSLCITEQKLFWAGKDSFLGKIYFLTNTPLWAASKLTKNYNKPDLPWRIWGGCCKNGTFQYFFISSALRSGSAQITALLM